MKNTGGANENMILTLPSPLRRRSNSNNSSTDTIAANISSRHSSGGASVSPAGSSRHSSGIHSFIHGFDL